MYFLISQNPWEEEREIKIEREGEEKGEGQRGGGEKRERSEESPL